MLQGMVTGEAGPRAGSATVQPAPCQERDNVTTHHPVMAETRAQERILMKQLVSLKIAQVNSCTCCM